jgi:hypothetical protein
MKLILTILLIVTFNYSITAQENTDSLMNAFIPAKKTAVFYKNKTIQFKTNDSINPDYEIISGKSLVFEYDFHSKDIISMSDDEVSEKILFEVTPRSKSFYLADKKLLSVRSEDLPITVEEICEILNEHLEKAKYEIMVRIKESLFESDLKNKEETWEEL